VDTEEEFDWSAPLASANAAVNRLRAQAPAKAIFQRRDPVPTRAVPPRKVAVIHFCPNSLARDFARSVRRNGGASQRGGAEPTEVAARGSRLRSSIQRIPAAEIAQPLPRPFPGPDLWDRAMAPAPAGFGSVRRAMAIGRHGSLPWCENPLH
jgi:hypothetical protein